MNVLSVLTNEQSRSVSMDQSEASRLRLHSTSFHILKAANLSRSRSSFSFLSGGKLKATRLLSCFPLSDEQKSWLSNRDVGDDGLLSAHDWVAFSKQSLSSVETNTFENLFSQSNVSEKNVHWFIPTSVPPHIHTINMFVWRSHFFAFYTKYYMIPCLVKNFSTSKEGASEIDIE